MRGQPMFSNNQSRPPSYDEWKEQNAEQLERERASYEWIAPARERVTVRQVNALTVLTVWFVMVVVFAVAGVTCAYVYGGK